VALELVTITEAESRKGLARSTIIRWLKAKRIEKREQGKVAVADLDRCIREQRTGRPCMSGRPLKFDRSHDHRTVAQKNMEPYCGGQGLPRLKRMIEALAWELAERGQDLTKLRDILVAALAETKTIEDRHRDLIKVYGERKRFPRKLPAS
jgi:hypothetical protein